MVVISLPRIVTIQSKVHLMTGLFKPDYAACSDPQMNLASIWLTQVLLARVLIYTTVQSTSYCRPVNSFPQFPIQIFSRLWHAPNQSSAGPTALPTGPRGPSGNHIRTGTRSEIKPKSCTFVKQPPSQTSSLEPKLCVLEKKVSLDR